MELLTCGVPKPKRIISIRALRRVLIPWLHGSFENACGIRANSFSRNLVKDMGMSSQSYGEEFEGYTLLP